MSEAHLGKQITLLRLASCQTEIRLLQQLIAMEERIMSAISDFAAKQAAHNTAIDTALSDIQVEIKTLNDQITALQNSAGQVTPADQALLDGMETTVAALQAKAQALDNLTPPTPPSA